MLEMRSQPAQSAPRDTTPLVEINNVAKTYETVDGADVVALEPTRLTVEEGEFVSIVGPSGCGKTTLLNLLGGLLEPSEGEILFDGRPIRGPIRDIGMVFQRPVLLPWRKVIDNVMLPVEVMKLPDAAASRQTALDLLKMVGLAGFERSYPKELSGGMQQRAAIARALVYDSRLLLMDEPFAALDAMTREEMNMELLRIWRETGKAIVFVTHNIPEAALLSDRVVVMTPRPGKIREIIEVDLARPRSLSLMGDQRFGEIVDRIRSLLGLGDGDNPQPRGERSQ
ncbi:MAG: ABC transporter ATP-binding protein [Azospirillaceae bacterium]